MNPDTTPQTPTRKPMLEALAVYEALRDGTRWDHGTCMEVAVQSAPADLPTETFIEDISTRLGRIESLNVGATQQEGATLSVWVNTRFDRAIEAAPATILEAEFRLEWAGDELLHKRPRWTLTVKAPWMSIPQRHDTEKALAAKLRKVYPDGPPPAPAAPDTCRFRHHEEFGQPMPECEIHPGTKWICGPFMHGCPTCQPDRCGLCGSLRLTCAC